MKRYGYRPDPEPYRFDTGVMGRIDVNGIEWWACDPYPTWFRWDEDGLHTDPAPWADEQ